MSIRGKLNGINSPGLCPVCHPQLAGCDVWVLNGATADCSGGLQAKYAASMQQVLRALCHVATLWDLKKKNGRHAALRQHDAHRDMIVMLHICADEEQNAEFRLVHHCLHIAVALGATQYDDIPKQTITQ